MVIKGKRGERRSDETVYLMDIVGRYSRPRRAGLRFRANALFIITMEREETERQEGGRRTEKKQIRTAFGKGSYENDSR